MKLSLAVLCCTVAAASFGTTLYVSSTAAGGGDGSEANPYTMSEAWKNVKANDTIQLADGTYVEEAVRGDKDNACFTVRDKSNITFQGNVEHPENVIIDFNGTSNRGFYSPNQPFTVRGITFQNKKTNTSRGVIAAGGTINGTALVENCRFVNITTDQTSGDGRMGTVFLGGATADFVFRNCEIKDCNCYVWGAMYLTAGTLTLQHCTVTNCHAKTYNASVIGVNGGSSVTIENCVADVSGLTGVTSVSASPFVDAENGDYTLAKTVSDGQGGRRANPCLGAGVKLDWMTAESLDLAGHPRMREKDLVDLGCYEYFRETPGFSIFVR